MIRTLNADEWQLYREARLAALKDAPDAFVARFADEATHSEDFWRKRMTRAHRIIAEIDDKPVGVVSLGLHNDDPATGEVFGLWTAPVVRGQRGAADLVSRAADQAIEDGRTMLYFWVGSDNAAAVGFASSFGFRPTDERRPVRRAEGAAEENADAPTADEVAMVLSLMPDPTQVQTLYQP